MILNVLFDGLFLSTRPWTEQSLVRTWGLRGLRLGGPIRIPVQMC